MRSDLDLDHFKNKLLQELDLVQNDLATVGRRNPNNKEDWEGMPSNIEVGTADENELADKIEEYEENTAVVKELEIRYNDIKSALEKIERGDYGTCEVSGEPIEIDRLEANPAAHTCKQHMN